MHGFCKLYFPCKINEFVVLETMTAFAFVNHLFTLNFSIIIGVLKDFRDSIAIVANACFKLC